jgi:hypothetical protein
VTKRKQATINGRVYITDTDFVEVLDALRAMPGARAEREGWPYVETAPGEFVHPHLVWVPGSTITVTADRPLGQALPHLIGRQVGYRDHIDRIDPYDVVGPWTPSQEDLLTADWTVSWPTGEARRG